MSTPQAGRLALGLALLAVVPSTAAEEHEAARGAEAGVPVISVTDRLPGDTVSAARLPVPPNEIPISVEWLRRDHIELTGYRDLAELLDVATSALTVTSEGGIFSDVILRGFGNTPFYRNGLNDSLGQLAPRALVNIERVEVLKGPNAALFGPGEPGGAINFVTKRPETRRAAELAGEFGRFDGQSFSADATGPFTPDGDAQYRLVASRDQGDTFRDFVRDDRWFVAPSLAYQPAPGVDLVAAVEYVRDRRLLDTGVAALAGGRRLPRPRFLGEPSSGSAELDGLTGSLALSADLGKSWELGADAYFQSTRVDGRAAEPVDFDGVVLRREAQRRNEQTDALVLQAEVSGPRLLAARRHDLLFGVEATALNEDVTRQNSDADNEPFAIDPFAPVYGQAFPALEPARQSAEQRRQLSVYAQDLWSLGDRWRMLFGGRYDYIDQSGSDRTTMTRFENARGRFSPRISLVHVHPRGLTWYASYSESLDPNEGLRPDGSALSPTLGKSVESGLRWTSADERIAFDLAGFGIRQTGVTVDAPGNPGFEIQTGRQENLGVDVALRFVPLPELSVQARYNYLDSSITNDPSLPDGTAALNAPRHQGGLFAVYSGTLSRTGDFAAGVALNLVGERQASLEPSELALRLGGFLRLDAFVRYEPARWLELRLRLQNLTDTRYVAGSQSDALRLTPGAPFDVRGELRLRF